MKFARLSLVVSATLIARAAHADQCAWVTADVAQRASGVLVLGQQMATYCEACGDALPRSAVPIRSVEMQATGPAGLIEITVNGTTVDLAYTYVGGSPDDAFVNVGLAADCGATGVGALLALDTTASVEAPQPPSAESGTVDQPSARPVKPWQAALTAYAEQNQAIASQPLEVWVRITNATDAAYANANDATVWFGSAIMGEAYVEEQVYATAVTKAVAKFQEKGIQADVIQGQYQVPAATAVTWGSEQSKVYSFPAGSYRMMKITILDPVATARTQESAAMVGLGASLSGDLVRQKVRDAVEQQIISAMAESSVVAYVIRTR